MSWHLVFDFIKAYFISPHSNSSIRKIAWISFSSFALSVFSLVLVLSIMKALNQRIYTRLLSVEPHMTISFLEEKSWDILENLPLVQLLKNEDVENQFFIEKQDLILRTWNGRFHGSVAMGIDLENLKWMLESRNSNKANISFLKDNLDNNQIFLGADLADILGLYPGDSLYTVFPSYLIESHFETPRLQKLSVVKNLRSNVPEMDSSYLFYSLSNQEGLLRTNTQKIKQTLVWLKNPQDTWRIKEKLSQLGENILVETWQERNESTFFALKVERFIIGFFLTLALVVAAFSLVMSLSLLISHKRKELNLLLVLGLSPFHFQKLVAGLCFGLAGGGLTVGLSLGLIVILLLEKYPLEVLPDIYNDVDITAQVDGSVFFALSIFGFLLILVMSKKLSQVFLRESLSKGLK